jgi:GTP1/Obg family GTP-binding protein
MMRPHRAAPTAEHARSYNYERAREAFGLTAAFEIAAQRARELAAENIALLERLAAYERERAALVEQIDRLTQSRNDFQHAAQLWERIAHELLTEVEQRSSDSSLREPPSSPD